MLGNRKERVVSKRSRRCSQKNLKNTTKLENYDWIHKGLILFFQKKKMAWEREKYHWNTKAHQNVFIPITFFPFKLLWNRSVEKPLDLLILFSFTWKSRIRIKLESSKPGKKLETHTEFIISPFTHLHFSQFTRIINTSTTKNYTTQGGGEDRRLSQS